MLAVESLTLRLGRTLLRRQRVMRFVRPNQCRRKRKLTLPQGTVSKIPTTQMSHPLCRRPFFGMGCNFESIRA